MEDKNVSNRLRNEKEKYDSDVTQEDIDALGSKGLSMDTGDDRLLEKRKKTLDFTGKKLDVPGRDTINNTTKSLSDEENTLYGQGSESKKSLEAPERANTNKSK